MPKRNFYFFFGHSTLKINKKNNENNNNCNDGEKTQNPESHQPVHQFQ